MVMSLRGPWSRVVVPVIFPAFFACDPEAPPTRPEAVVSQLRPRVSAPARLRIASPAAPGLTVEVDVDEADTFTLTSSEADAEAFADALEGLELLYGCFAEFGELGPLDALCASVADGAEIVVEVTAVPAKEGDVVEWSEIERFDAGCAPTSSPETLRCTLTDAGPVLSPLATFTTPDDPPPPPPGDCEPSLATAGGISTIAPWRDKLIVGGAFLEGVVQRWPGPVELGDDGVTVTACPQGPDSAFSAVVDLIEDEDGGMIVSGSFAGWGGEPDCVNVARIAPDGAVDGAFCAAMPELVGPVHVARAGSVLYAAGRSGVVALDLQALTELASAPALQFAPEQGPTDLAVVGDAVYLAGPGLRQIGDQEVSGLGALDADDLSESTFAPDFDIGPTVLAVTGEQLWVGGSFGTIGADRRDGLAVFDATTGTLTGIDAGLDGVVFDLFAGADGVWLAGAFDTAAGSPRNSIARFGTDGVLAPDDLPLDREGGFTPSVGSVVEVDGVVAVSGSFDLVDGVPQRGLARFERATGAVLDSTAAPVGPALFAVGDALWAFAPSGLGLVERYGVVIVDPATGEVDPLDLELDNQVREVFVDGDIAYLTGFFTEVRGVARSRIAAVDLTTGEVLPFAPTVDSTVDDIEFGPDTVYIGGFFSTVNGQSRPAFAALQKSDGSLKPGFSTVLSADNVRAIELFGGNVIVGGLIASVNGVDRGDLVWVDAQTGVNAPVTTSVQTATPVAEVFDGELWVESSTFPDVSGLPAYDELFAIDPATGALRNWQPGMEGGAVDSLLKVGDAVMVAGFEIRIGGETRSLWALDANTGEALDWSPRLTGEPRVLVAFDGQVVIGTERGELRFVDPPR